MLQKLKTHSSLGTENDAGRLCPAIETKGLIWQKKNVFVDNSTSQRAFEPNNGKKPVFART